MRVINIIQRYHPAIGGSESWCRNLCRFLCRKGVFTDVATINVYDIQEAYRPLPLQQQHIALGEFDSDEGVLIRRYKLWKFWSPSVTARLANFLLHKTNLAKTQLGDIFRCSPISFEMYRDIHNQIKRADIVILHTLPYFHNLVGYLFAKLFNKPLIIIPYFHVGHIHYEKDIFFKIMKRCDAVITLSEFEKAHFVKKGIDPKKIFVTGSSINQEEMAVKIDFNTFKHNLFNKYGIDNSYKRIIFLGRKEIYKGIDILIKAVENLGHQERIKLCLFLVGPDTEAFLNMFPVLTNSENLKIINFGVVSDNEKEYLMRLSDLLVLPSQFESFGIVFLEAWKYKKPVIGSNRGAIPSVIQGAGLIADYGDVNALGEKIKSLLLNPELAQRLGELGYKRLKEHYTMEKIGKTLLDICHSIRKQKRVLIVSHLFPPHCLGGAEIVAYEQAKILKKIGWRVNILAGKINNTERQYATSREKNEFEITRINLHDTDFDSKYFILEKEALITIFRKELFRIAPDIVHFHNISAFSLKMIDCCADLNIPTAMTLHDYWGICYKNTLLTDDCRVCGGQVEDCAFCSANLSVEGGAISITQRNNLVANYYNKVNLFISPSEYLAQKYTARLIPKNKIKVINNGIDLNRFQYRHKQTARKIRIGFVGRISRHKGFENIIKSISLLTNNEKRRMTLLVLGAGDDDYAQYCRSLINELKLNGIVKFYGSVNNKFMHKSFRRIDALALSSIWPENAPVSIMEALASGVPVLASDIGGIPELIRNQENGFLYKYDDPAALASIISDIIKHRSKIKNMNLACLAKARSYDIRKQVKNIAENYEHICRADR